MNAATIVFATLGVAVPFFTAVFVVTRSIIRQVNAVDANSKALADLRVGVASLPEKLDALDQRLAIQNDRLARLEGTVRRNGHPQA